MTTQTLAPVTARLQWKFISDAWIAAALYEAVDLRLADRLSGGPRTTATLAEATGTLEEPLYRVLRALASVGIFVEVDDRCFDLTPLASCLRLEADEVHAMALMFGGEERRSWRRLADTLRTGRDGFSIEHGIDLFHYLETAEDADRFHRAMEDHAALNHRGIVSAFDFHGCNHVVDVGGGNGALLVELLAKYPSLHGTLLDRPGVAEAARQRLAEAGVLGRSTVVKGDFFESVPTGADVYLLSAVLHNWDDTASIHILRNVAGAMRGRGRLVIAELILSDSNETSFGKLLDLNLMVMCPGGRERTRSEFEQILRAGGFSLEDIHTTKTLVSVLVGKPL